jgi:putative salt-induced outer membrane protein YdiY
MIVKLRHPILLVLLVVPLITVPAYSQSDKAAAATPPWLPAEPMPVDFDWIMLTSGEWLKGELIALYEDELEFDSDELDMLTLDWEDVAIVKTQGTREVLFADRSVAIGRVLVKDSQITVLGSDSRQRPRSAIISIADKEENFLQIWSGEITLSADIRNGNTEQEDFTLRAEAQRRTAKVRSLIEYLVNYGRAGSSKVEDNQRLTAAVDWFISKYWFLRPVQLEYYADEFQNIDSRITYTASIGYHLIDTRRTEWDVYLGPGYQQTKFEEVGAGDDDTEKTSVALLGTSYDTELTKDIDYDFKYEAQFVSEKAGEVNHRFDTGISIEFLGDFDLDIRYIIDRVEKPVADADGVFPDKQDTKLILGVSYEF